MVEPVKEHREQIARFVASANLVNIYNLFEENDAYADDLEDAVKETSHFGLSLPLPSGRVGNHVALALELGDFYTASFIMSNYDRLGLKHTAYASTLNDECEWTLRDHFDSALYVYEDDLTEDAKEQPIGFLKRKFNVK